MGETLQQIYAARVAAGDLTPDPAQKIVLPVLDDIRAHLDSRKLKGRGLLGGLFHRAEDVPQGLYLWGGVGRGKSMLMDMFFQSVQIKAKRRVHFHSFMQGVHEGLHKARQNGAEDAIIPVANRITQGLKLLAFDEMQINDITDAMIVGRLFEKLFEAGVVIVATSNRPPDDLYKDGLNRQLFLPFIALLKDRMVVHELASPTDYRRSMNVGHQSYFTPDNAQARAALDAAWRRLAGGQGAPLVLEVKGREVTLPAFRNGVARARFHDLCGKPLGPADYLAISNAVRVLILEGIPCLSRSNFNEAKRFVTLIDTLYEARVRLIASAAADPEMLYLEGDGAFEFERTASRLREMQGKDWAGDTGAQSGST
ncbi:MAG TPA: cell division protein ZapE [Aliiroseovarius sp.]|nr:cell division protein ZapE [Aliiroseovarius sp.]